MDLLQPITLLSEHCLRPRSILYVCLLLFLTNCKKKKEEPKSLAPEITFIQTTPTVVKEYSDKLTFTISYIDNNGDLGQNDPNVANLFLKDNRNDVVYEYRIKQLAPDNANIRISGIINIELANTAITNGTTSQQVTYSIYVKDRAGNTSNTVSSNAITVTKN